MVESAWATLVLDLGCPCEISWALTIKQDADPLWLILSGSPAGSPPLPLPLQVSGSISLNGEPESQPESQLESQRAAAELQQLSGSTAGSPVLRLISGSPAHWPSCSPTPCWLVFWHSSSLSRLSGWLSSSPVLRLFSSPTLWWAPLLSSSLALWPALQLSRYRADSLALQLTLKLAWPMARLGSPASPSACSLALRLTHPMALCLQAFRLALWISIARAARYHQATIYV